MMSTVEEKLVILREEIKELMEVYDSFFRLNERPKNDHRWKEMLEEHRYMKNLVAALQKQIEILDQL
jgi:hypothetical protein